MVVRGLALGIVALTLLAGCIQPSDPAVVDSPPPSTHNDGGNMTGSAHATNSTCAGQSSGKAFCAAKTIAVTGMLSGVSKMDVDLHSFNGNVNLRQSGTGSWSLTAQLKAYGASQQEAQANLEAIAFSWRHTDGSSHFVQAQAKPPAGNCQCDAQASIDVTVPSGVVLVVTESTTNGDVGAQGKTDGLSASTTNGDVTVDADATQVMLSTTNGDVHATLRPSASGRVSASSTNGDVVLSVPEDAQRGYDFSGKTTNGEVKIALKDGDLGPCPQGSQYYTPPCTSRTFKTHGFDQRAVQWTISGSSTNGDVDLKGA